MMSGFLCSNFYLLAVMLFSALNSCQGIEQELKPCKGIRAQEVGICVSRSTCIQAKGTIVNKCSYRGFPGECCKLLKPTQKTSATVTKGSSPSFKTTTKLTVTESPASFKPTSGITGTKSSDTSFKTTSGIFVTKSPSTSFMMTSGVSVTESPVSFRNTTGTRVTESPSASFQTAQRTINDPEFCGKRPLATPKVIGGKDALSGAWPWQVVIMVRYKGTWSQDCGAALINQKWAITAAHCVENRQESRLLRFGEHDLSNEREAIGHLERKVNLIVTHENYDKNYYRAGYDLALLRFDTPVQFQSNVSPVCLPKDNATFVGFNATVTGWGDLSQGGSSPDVLQETVVPVISNSECKTWYESAGRHYDFPERLICAGLRKGGHDTCKGDSGGPLVIRRPDDTWVLAGVTSWGDPPCGAPNQPGVYTRVSTFREWIDQVISANSPH